MDEACITFQMKYFKNFVDFKNSFDFASTSNNSASTTKQKKKKNVIKYLQKKHFNGFEKIL